jgi:hypothetical protein
MAFDESVPLPRRPLFPPCWLADCLPDSPTQEIVRSLQLLPSAQDIRQHARTAHLPLPNLLAAQVVESIVGFRKIQTVEAKLIDELGNKRLSGIEAHPAELNGGTIWERKSIQAPA